MRTIKFRGKSNIDGEWFYGNLYDKDNRDKTHICTTRKGCLDIDPDTVGQLTGFMDKNDNDVYEHDIVTDQYGSIGVVEWQNGQFVVNFDDVDFFRIQDCFDESYKMRIIGNIHDNPELLKGDM